MSVPEVSGQPEPTAQRAFQTGRESVRWIEALWVVVPVGAASRQLLAYALKRETVGEPDAGNLHVRFDEGATDEQSRGYGPR
jgi:hypothetical protein